MDDQVADLQRAASALVERARSLQAEANREKTELLEHARQEAARECEQMRADTRCECQRVLQQAERRHEQLSREAAAMSDVHAMQDSMIKLDIGGHVFTTSIHTLRSVPGSMLSGMFSGRFELKKTEEQCVFIDRNGALFDHVLEYLRDRVVHVQDLDATTLRRLQREFAFYGLELGREEEHTSTFIVGGLIIRVCATHRMW